MSKNKVFTINNATLLFVVRLETGTVQASADTIIPLELQQPKLHLNQQKQANKVCLIEAF
ncbi:hypothetical protein DBX26_05825 [Vibrio sp. dhg]|nr:hypothetical protein DBX26_05825 [Vibrio sp. dhg]